MGCPENVQVKILKGVPQVPMNSIVLLDLPLVGGFFPKHLDNQKLKGKNVSKQKFKTTHHQTVLIL